MVSVEEKIRELSEHWRGVYVVHQPGSRRLVNGEEVWKGPDEWIVRDHTDEGLAGEGRRVRAESLEAALDKALEDPMSDDLLRRQPA